MNISALFTLFLTLSAMPLLAQEYDQAEDYLSLSWQKVATQMSEEWYGSEEAKRIAENVLLAQKDIGGWPKNDDFHRVLSEAEKDTFKAKKSTEGATFDNDATTTELRFLAKVHSHFPDLRYRQAFERGLHYVFIAQYDNGGWPQFFPFIKKGMVYSSHITYNDNAMANILQFLRGVFAVDGPYSSLQIDEDLQIKAREAFDRGIDCILKTQIIVDGQPTVWCAQHDQETLAPVKARSYELASFSGSESVNIVQLLMEIENPSKEIIASVNGAIQWFDEHRVKGVKLKYITNEDGEEDRIIVEDEKAPSLWARFYDLETGKPFFSDRDGIKKNSLAEIGHERRNGYGWYTRKPSKALKQYFFWKKNLEAE